MFTAYMSMHANVSMFLSGWVCVSVSVCERECDVTAVEHVLVFRAVSPE